MTLKQRLKRLEGLRQGSAEAPSLVVLDPQGRILESGSAAVRPWIGRHFSELPKGGSLKVYRGFDPGDLCGPPEPRPGEHHGWERNNSG